MGSGVGIQSDLYKRPHRDLSVDRQKVACVNLNLPMSSIFIRYQFRKLHILTWIQPNRTDPDQNEMWSMYLTPKVVNRRNSFCIEVNLCLQHAMLLSRQRLLALVKDDSPPFAPIIYISRYLNPITNFDMLNLLAPQGIQDSKRWKRAPFDCSHWKSRWHRELFRLQGRHSQVSFSQSGKNRYFAGEISAQPASHHKQKSFKPLE